MLIFTCFVFQVYTPALVMPVSLVSSYFLYLSTSFLAAVFVPRSVSFYSLMCFLFFFFLSGHLVDMSPLSPILIYSTLTYYSLAELKLLVLAEMAAHFHQSDQTPQAPREFPMWLKQLVINSTAS